MCLMIICCHLGNACNSFVYIYIHFLIFYIFYEAITAETRHNIIFAIASRVWTFSLLIYAYVYLYTFYISVCIFYYHCLLLVMTLYIFNFIKAYVCKTWMNIFKKRDMLLIVCVPVGQENHIIPKGMVY